MRITRKVFYDLAIWMEAFGLSIGIEENVQSDGVAKVRVTVSIGCAAYPNKNAENEDSLIQLADEALYRAKESGRNRVVLAL